jgi:hypothetical protein
MHKLIRVALPLVVLAIVAAATIASNCCIGTLCIPLG